MNELKKSELPVIVIGAGPIGMAAAAHLVAHGQEVVILEAGGSVAANLETYRQVRLFSRWKHNTDPVAVKLLEKTGWTHPDPEVLPTAGAIIDDYLQPLAAVPSVASSLRLNHRVTDVARAGFNKVTTGGRDEAPFLVRAHTPDGGCEYQARAVFDATGTWAQPSPLGANGLPALSEDNLAASICYGMPDVLEAHRHRYENKRVLVVGAGHSAVGNLLALAQLAQEAPSTQVVWAIRRSDPSKVFGNSNLDSNPSERAKLGLRLKDFYDSGTIELHTDFRVHSLTRRSGGIEVIGEPIDGVVPQIQGIDEIICATGARPDWHMTRELRLDFDESLESTGRLAALIDPNVHSCGMVRALTIDDIAHPETNYFVIGAKTYGRAPNFLMVTGYEQVRIAIGAFLGIATEPQNSPTDCNLVKAGSRQSSRPSGCSAQAASES